MAYGTWRVAYGVWLVACGKTKQSAWYMANGEAKGGYNGFSI